MNTKTKWYQKWFGAFHTVDAFCVNEVVVKAVTSYNAACRDETPPPPPEAVAALPANGTQESVLIAGGFKLKGTSSGNAIQIPKTT